MPEAKEMKTHRVTALTLMLAVANGKALFADIAAGQSRIDGLPWNGFQINGPFEPIGSAAKSWTSWTTRNCKPCSSASMAPTSRPPFEGTESAGATQAASP